MLSQAQLETILSAGVVLICLAASLNIWWILNGWQIGAIRRAWARLVWRIERNRSLKSYIRGLRVLAKDE